MAFVFVVSNYCDLKSQRPGMRPPVVSFNNTECKNASKQMRRCRQQLGLHQKKLAAAAAMERLAVDPASPILAG